MNDVFILFISIKSHLFANPNRQLALSPQIACRYYTSL